MLSVKEMQECIDNARAKRRELAQYVLTSRDSEYVRGFKEAIEYMFRQLQAKITEKVKANVQGEIPPGQG